MSDDIVRGLVAKRLAALCSILVPWRRGETILTSRQIALIESLQHRLYRERARAVPTADSLAIRATDTFVASYRPAKARVVVR